MAKNYFSGFKVKPYTKPISESPKKRKKKRLIMGNMWKRRGKLHIL